MLLTICPNCTAQFKVQPEQLNVRQGRVMCGRCRHVFNAFQSLSRLEEPEQSREPNLRDVTPAPQPTDARPHPTTTPNPAATSVESILFRRVEPAPAEMAYSGSKPFPHMPDSPVPTKPMATYMQLDQSPPTQPAASTQASPFDLQSTETPEQPAIELSSVSNPLLVEAAPNRAKRSAATSRLWQVGVFFLFVSLAAQAAYEFRTTLVNSVPELRPTFRQLCDYAGCSIPWGRDGTLIEIVGSELIEMPGKASRILLTATLINRAKTRQDVPSLALELTDNANQVVVGRVLHPTEYLGRSMKKDESIASNAEIYVSLTLDNKGKQLASGYGLKAFYP